MQANASKFKSKPLPLFALIRGDRNRNTCVNVSEISVNQTLKGF